MENVHPFLKVDKRKLVKVAKELLANGGRWGGEVSIALVDDEHIKRLNQEYLGRDYPTDVLCFPLDHMDDEDTGGKVLGDIYVSLDRAWEQSREYRVPFEEEVARLVFHGLLHLLRYDDQDEESRATMTEKQEIYVGRFKRLISRM